MLFVGHNEKSASMKWSRKFAPTNLLGFSFVIASLILAFFSATQIADLGPQCKLAALSRRPFQSATNRLASLSLSLIWRRY